MSLEVKNLSFQYKRGFPVFRDISFRLESGQVLSLLGPNGSGKTTLLKCVNRILLPTQGEVVVNGISTKGMPGKKLAAYMGYVPQETTASLSLNVIDAVFLGRTPYVDFKVGSKDKDIVFQTISLLGLNDLAFRMVNELSGGERQRVYLARALVQEPQILLLDEPTSSLDMRHQLETLQIVRDIAVKNKISIIMAIHDLNLAARYSDRVLMLKKGRLIAEGDYRQVITAENIRNVYQVEAKINDDEGIPVVIPVKVT